MSKNILLDTNLIIAAFDTKDSEAQEQLRNLLEDEEVAFAISPLIRYEVLRGIAFSDDDKYIELQKILNDFEEFDIGRDVSELSARIFRYAKQQERDIVNKRSFDVFHCATAKCNGLDICSNDSDIGKIDALCQEILDEA